MKGQDWSGQSLLMESGNLEETDRTMMGVMGECSRHLLTWMSHMTFWETSLFSFTWGTVTSWSFVVTVRVLGNHRRL